MSNHLALEAAGATVIPFGVGDSQLLVRTIRDLGIAAIHCTPSYPAALERTLAEHFPGLTPRFRVLGRSDDMVVVRASTSSPPPLAA